MKKQWQSIIIWHNTTLGSSREIKKVLYCAIKLLL